MQSIQDSVRSSKQAQAELEEHLRLLRLEEEQLKRDNLQIRNDNNEQRKLLEESISLSQSAKEQLERLKQEKEDLQRGNLQLQESY